MRTLCTSPFPVYPKHLHHCCSYLVIPIPGPPTPIPPPAAAPLTGFMCCPAPGPAAGPPGITDPIIPAAPGSPGCPPPSMLASFPISVSAQETGGRWRKVSGQIGDVAFISLCCLFHKSENMNGKRGPQIGRANSALLLHHRHHHHHHHPRQLQHQ